MRNAKAIKNENSRAMLDGLLKTLVVGSTFTSFDLAKTLSKRHRNISSRAVGRFLMERKDVSSSSTGKWTKIGEPNQSEGVSA